MLRASGVKAPKGRGSSFRAYEFMVGVQLALALALVIGTGLLLRSLSARLSVSLGVQPRNVATIRTDLPFLPELVDTAERYYQQHHLNKFGNIPSKDAEALDRLLAPATKAERVHAILFNREAQRNLAMLPEVVSVGVMDPVPLTFSDEKLLQMLRVCTLTSPRVSWASGVKCLPGSASSNAFELLGIHLLAGRSFSPEDVAAELANEEAGGRNETGQSCVAIINEALARTYWPHDNPVGKQLYYGLTPRRVVGVVSNFHQSVWESEITPAIYFPSSDLNEEASFVVKLRSEIPLRRFDGDAYRELLRLAPDLPHPTCNSLEDMTESSSHNLRFALTILTCFALLGATVAGIGAYAVAALAAAARSREIGIRLALGATPEEIRYLALWRNLRLVLMALPFGLLTGWGLAHALSHFLFRVKPLDPITYLAGGVLMGIIVLVAGLPSAIRTAATDPAKVLRDE